MSFTLRGTNFQAWEDFEFEASGLTVLIGDSNEGKSAIFRSLRGLVRNELGAHYVRNGSKKLEVSLTMGDRTYTGTRTRSGSTKYVVNPGETKYESIGRDVPQPIRDLMMGEVEIGKESIDPVFARQGSTQFLLEESGPMLNTILGAFSSTEKLEGGKTEAKARMGRLNSEAGTLAAQLRQTEEIKAKLEVLASHADEIDRRLQDLLIGVSHGQEVSAVLDSLIARRIRLEHLSGIISRLVVPVTAEVEGGLNRLAPLSQLAAARTQHEHLASLAKRLVAPATARVESGLRQLVSLGQLVDARTEHIHLSSLIKKLTTLDVGPLLVRAEIVRLLGIIPSAKSRLSAIRGAHEKAEILVMTWTRLVAEHRLAKCITEAIDQINVRDNSTAKTYADRLGTLQASVEAHHEHAALQYRQAATLAKLVQAEETWNLLNAQAEEADLTLSSLQVEVTRIQNQLEEARAEEYRLAHEITCPSCGDNFIPGATGEHTHDNNISYVGE